MVWTQDLRDVPRWNLIVRVKGVLRTTCGSDWPLNILRGSHVYFEDDFCSGYWNVSHYQQFFSGLLLPRRTIKFHRAINYFPVTCHAIVYTYLLIKISPHACTSVTSLLISKSPGILSPSKLRADVPRLQATTWMHASLPKRSLTLWLYFNIARVEEYVH